MARVLVSIGSNIDRYKNISASLDALDARFSDLQVSRVYESEAVGFEGDNFLNLVAAFECEWGVAELAMWLREVEEKNGRRRDGPKFSSRTLDIDILTYDDVSGVVDGIELPREEIIHNAFVLWPLVDIAAASLHPQLQRSYQSLWDDFDKPSQKLWPVDFSWQGKVISAAQ